MDLLRSFVSETQRFVVAHRGSSGTAPENTMASFRNAISDGARMIELDVQLTASNDVIVFHDDVLGRTTNGQGQVRTQSLADLQKLDAGSWFSEQFINERIPTLAEALDFLRDKSFVNIEIKPPKESDFRLRLEKVMETVFAAKMETHTLFSSFHHRTLRELKERYPQLHTAAINVPGDKRMPSELSRETGCEGFVCSIHELTQKRVDDAHKHNLYIGVYTINRKDQFDKAYKMGVKALVTNFPANLTQWMSEQQT